MQSRRVSRLFVFLATTVVVTASVLDSEQTSPTLSVVTRPAVSASDPGDLISVTTNKVTVGVLLNEMPADVRDRFADDILRKHDGWWQTRARRQLAHTLYKLQFRAAFFPDGSGKNQLMLPANSDAITITFTSAPSRHQLQGHDMITRSYTVSTYIVGLTGTAVQADPDLGTAGGSTTMQFWLPVDPYLIFQRTGAACMDEDQFPRNSLDAEATEVYYDDTCTAGPAAAPGVQCASIGCHCTLGADDDCPTALQKFTGKARMTITFKRVHWDEDIATTYEAFNSYSYNPAATGADLVGYIEGMQHNAIVYKYFVEGSCESLECIDGHGWRKLILFDGIHVNVGPKELEIGDVQYIRFNQSSFDEAAYHHIYYWDPCHQHPHFSQYSTYLYDTNLFGHKQGFCIQDTNRIINSRKTSIVASHNTCSFQGITAGWADNYNVGIPCQWVDVTKAATSAGPISKDLTMIGNPSSWLCEGVVQKDSAGNILWEPTGNVTVKPPWPQAGLPIDKYKCAPSPGAMDRAANTDNIPVTVPPHGQGLLTGTCKAPGQIFGHKRDCEFTPRAQMNACNAGKSVTLTCSIPRNSPSQVLRLCESSVKLGAGTACRFNDDFTLANVIVSDCESTTFSFKCPAARAGDSDEVGGYFAIYSAPVYNTDAFVEIKCNYSKSTSKSADVMSGAPLSTGASIGLIVAGVVVAAVFVASAAILRRRRELRRSPPAELSEVSARGSVSQSVSALPAPAAVVPSNSSNVTFSQVETLRRPSLIAV